MSTRKQNAELRNSGLLRSTGDIPLRCHLLAAGTGKAAQQINLTSTSVTFNAQDMARAREIVREIRAGQEPRALRAPTAATEGL